MSLVIARDLVLAAVDNLPNHALIGWRNSVTIANIAADTENAAFPAVNLANPATNQRWQAASTAEQYLTHTTGSADDYDYIGIARHNLASAAIAVSIEGNTGAGFTELVAPVLLPNDGPAMFRYARGPRSAIRLRLQAGNAPATIAVCYAGKLLTLERAVYQGHTPLPDGLVTKATNGRSESGNFLGRIVTGEYVASKLPLSLISPDWYRANLRPFLQTAKDLPFFLAWRPDDYPYEVGYAWLTNDPAPSPQSPHSRTSLTLDLAGVV